MIKSSSHNDTISQWMLSSCEVDILGIRRNSSNVGNEEGGKKKLLSRQHQNAQLKQEYDSDQSSIVLRPSCLRGC